MGKHSRRVIVIRCNATDSGQRPPNIFKSEKYEYPFPNDGLKQQLVALAIQAYREDQDVPAGVAVTTAESTIQNR
jgi:hypothetical protein